MMKRLLLVLFVLLLVLTACQRGGSPAEEGEGFEGLPDVSAEPGESEGFGTAEDEVYEPGLGSDATEEPALQVTTPEAELPAEGEPVEPQEPSEQQEPGSPPDQVVAPLEGRFTNLRFASSSTGFEQSNFPIGTEEIYAIWDYQDMKPEDTMERLWYHNDELYVERREKWDFDKYGASGTVRDIFLYNRVDGIFPGNWRVEIYLNGEQQLVGNYTVGGP